MNAKKKGGRRIMSEQFVEHEGLSNETQETLTSENSSPVDTSSEPRVIDTPEATKPKPSKKKLAAVVIAVLSLIAIALIIFVPSKFDRVRSECLHIVGRVNGSGDYFMIDTLPDEYNNLDETAKALLLPNEQKKALEAIKYANEELGFNGSVYSQMLNTTALMGRQSAETDKYRVSWTYHPDDGLEVTYEKK